MNIDSEVFEKEWTLLGKKICNEIYIKPEIQELKHALQKNGFMSLEENSKFIDICNKTKYEIIYAQYGKEDSDAYKNFSKAWENWLQEKGVESQKERSQKSSVDHILFGSTPDPTQFLLHFEEEMLGSMK